MNRVSFGVAAGVVLLCSTSPAQAPRRVLDARPGPADSVQSAGLFAAPAPKAGELFLVLDDGVLGAELWLSDGSATGTRLLIDLSPGPASTSFLGWSAAADGLWFVVDAQAQRELWHCDGTAAGTRLVFATAAQSLSPPNHFFADGSFLFGHGGQTWRSDRNGTQLAALGMPEGYLVAVLQGLPWIHDGTARGLWRSDGSVGGTVLVAPNVDLAMPALGGVLAVQTSGTQSTLQVFGVTPSPQTTLNEPVFAFAMGNAIGLLGTTTLWRWDGASPPQVLRSFASLLDPTTGTTIGFRPDGQGLLFRADDGIHGFEPWWTDLSANGTRLLGDFSAGPASSTLGASYGTGARVVFWMTQPATGSEPWSSDGTPAGTQLLADLEPGPGSSTPDNFSGIGGLAGERRVLLPISTSATGNELWISDGTSAGTRLLGDLRPGPASSISPWTFWGWTAGTRFLYAADDGVHGAEPHAVDLEGARAHLLGGCSGSAVYSVGDPVLGAAWPLRAGGLDVAAFGFALLALPASSPLALGSGCLVQLDPPSTVTIAGIFPDAGGRWTGSLTLPSTPSLRGAALVTQAILVPSTHPLGFEMGTAWWVTLGF